MALVMDVSRRRRSDRQAADAHLAFRARLRAASYSRAEMATVMAETLRALGYDVSEWDAESGSAQT